MRLLSQLSFSFAGLLLAALLGGALAIWTTWQMGFSLTRSDYSHSSYQAHLALSAHVNELWARSVSESWPDSNPVAREANEANHARLQNLIQEDIVRIRDLIAREIALVGEEEIALRGRRNPPRSIATPSIGAALLQSTLPDWSMICLPLPVMRRAC